MNKVFFLGGHDLEMVAIAELLSSHNAEVFDKQLGWGAKASAYESEIRDCLNAGHCAVFVELANDLGQVSDSAAIEIVDHHDEKAGIDAKSSLRQVFEMLSLNEDAWTRELALVDANDRGHCRAMSLLSPPASRKEMEQIRQRDRQAQNITAEEEQSGRQAALSAKVEPNAPLTVVELEHCHCATVVDALTPELGGQGFENLLVFTPASTNFFGNGVVAKELFDRYQGGWCGGNLPIEGYWGLPCRLDPDFLVPVVANEFVHAFHHILVWPLLMRGFEGEKPGVDKLINRFVDAYQKAGWKETKGGSDCKVDSDYSFAEVVYFHPTVRDFLFGDGCSSSEARILRRFSREDIQSLSVTIDDFPVDLRVERMELLLVRPKVAMLVVEVSNRQLAEPAEIVRDDPQLEDPRTPIPFSLALKLQNQLRHIYPPYFIGEKHGECPARVAWNGLETKSALAAGSSPTEFEAFTRQGAEPPMYGHWLQLFNEQGGIERIKPLRQASEELDDRYLYMQQLLDDRMAAMSFLAVPDPALLTQPDEDCLVDFNSRGFGYEAEFQRQCRHEFRYDRFRHLGTTYYCNGSSFALVCRVGDLARPGENFSNLLIVHFRRHYRHLAFIAQYQHAALLYFAHELASLVSQMKLGKDTKEWRDRLEELQERFLKFRTRAYFTEVSNQIQGKDLFSLWFERLGTQKLFDQVASTSHGLYEAVENAAATTQSEINDRVTRVEKLFLPALITAQIVSVFIALIPIFQAGTGYFAFAAGVVILAFILVYVLFQKNKQGDKGA